MKRVLFVLLLLGGLGVAIGQERSADNPLEYRGPDNPKVGTLNYLDFKGGFKNFILGNKVSDYKDVLEDYPSLNDNTQKYYRATNLADMTINNIPVKQLLVGVFNDRISMIIVLFENNYGRDLYDVLKTAYGNGYKSNRYIDSYSWSASEVTMIFNFEGSRDCTLAMQSKTFDKAIEKDKRANSNRGVSDL